jgi:hypothetical protein
MTVGASKDELAESIAAELGHLKIPAILRGRLREYHIAATDSRNRSNSANSFAQSSKPAWRRQKLSAWLRKKWIGFRKALPHRRRR